MQDSALSKFVIGLLGFYQNYLSPLKGPRCRFYPSCSEYCAQAVRERGVLPGLGLGALRILRCHPLNPGGYDPVPRRRRREEGRATEDE
jgi:hypothetical protein